MSVDAARTLHVGVAEAGKVWALRGDHTRALQYYREAMAMAVRQGAPEVLVRHYLECALESLEHMGAYSDVVAYCDRAIEHYEQHPPVSPLAQLDLASIHQRRGVTLLKQNDRAAAASALQVACAIGASVDAHLPLAETLLRWLKAQLTVSVERIVAEQTRHHYHSVRAETARPSRAMPLPGHPPLTPAAIVTSEGAV